MSCCSSVLSGNFVPQTTPTVVDLASTANIDLGAFTPGVLVDGVASAAGDVVLVRRQSTASQNGVYLVTSSSIVRHPSFDAAVDFVPGLRLAVRRGNWAAGRVYEVLDFVATLNVSSIAFDEVWSSTQKQWVESNDFDGSNPAADWVVRLVGTGSAAPVSAVEDAHPGIYRLTTTAAADQSAIHGLSHVRVTSGIASLIEVRFIMRTPNALPNAQGSVMALGLLEYPPPMVGPALTGVYFVSNPPTYEWICRVQENNIPLAGVNTGVSSLSNDWHEFAMLIDGTPRVRYYIDEQLVGTANVLPTTPTDIARYMAVLQTGAGGPFDVDVDQYSLRVRTPRP